jgi:hypothetical protein
VWSSNALRSNVNDVSFSSNVSVGLSLIANSVLVNDVYANNNINAYAGLTTGGDIVPQMVGGNNIGTSENPFGSVNSLTASLEDATTTSLSNSGVILMNYGDGDKVVLTNVGTNASRFTHSSGWDVGYFACYTTATSGQHNFYTATTGSWANPMYINGNAVNITNKLAVNQSVDSGVGRGIFWWNDEDPNWTSYFASSGANRSSANGTACTRLDGRTAHHHRARAGNSATQGFLWENTSDQCVMSLTPDTGNLYVRSLVQTSNINVGQALTAATFSNSGNVNIGSLLKVPTITSTTISNAGTFTMKNSADSSMSGAHLWYYPQSDNNPLFQQLNWVHDKISLNFDSCYNSGWFAGSCNASYQIYKIGGSLIFNYAKVPATSSITWSTAVSINLNGNIGLGTTAPVCKIDYGLTSANLQLALYSGGGSAYGFGALNSALQYQTAGDHAWFISSTTSAIRTERLRIKSTGELINQGNMSNLGTLTSATHSNRGDFYNGGTGAFAGQLTLSNGLAMKTSNWITSVPDNANRMYFAQSADTVFNSPTGTYSFYDKTGGAYLMQLTSNLGWRNPNGDPGMLICTSYGTPATTLDLHGSGQFANGTMRAVISGSFSPATFKVCKPSNSNLFSFTDLMTVDALTATCTARNFTAQNNIFCGNNATISGKINCSTYDNAGANINFMKGSSTSNLVLYADGSALHRGGIVCSTTQISSNVFSGDSTMSHVNNHNSTGYALTQSSGGLTTVNATTGNSARLAVGGSLTAKVSRYDWSLGYDVSNLPAGAALGTGPCIVSRPGGWATMYFISGRYELGIPQADLWETSTNMAGELTCYFKNTSTTIPGVCVVRYYITQVFGGALDFVQLDFSNNGLSVNNAYVFNNGFYVQLNTNAAQCYASWTWTGVL